MTTTIGNFTKGSRTTRTRNNFKARAKKAFFPVLALALGGCAIHPVQKDVTGLRTVDIVDRIRCETRLAIQDKAIELLGQLPDEPSQAVAEYLRTHREAFMTFDPRKLPTAAQRAFYNRYVRTGIAYDFTFDITEDNKAAAVVDPIRLITNGTAGIGLNASGEFNRNNSRHFVMSDTFENLLHNRTLPCDGRYKPENFAYPIAGSIGVAELISTFIDLNEDKQLDTANSRVFADTLTFMTTLIGSASPHVELTPPGNRWGLASPTNFTASAQRIDTHKLIIGLSMDDAAINSPRATGVPIPGFTGSRSALQKSSVGTSAEQRALDAVTQQRIDTYLDRFGTFQLR